MRQLEEMLEQKHERDLMDLNILGLCLVNGEKGKIFAVSSLTVHHEQHVRLTKWLHMEERSFLQQNVLAVELGVIRAA